MQLFYQMHMDQALELVRDVEACQEVFSVTLLPTDGDEPHAVPPQLDLTMVAAVVHPDFVEGTVPDDIPSEREYSTHASLALGLPSQEAYTRLTRYLHSLRQLDPIPVEALGNCLFSAIRRTIDVPLEYQNVHLRRQLVMLLANHHECFLPLLKPSLMATYGHIRMDQDTYDQRFNAGQLSQAEIDDQNCPGPFSYMGYMRALLQDRFWGDEICLTLTSMMFQIGIMVLDAETFLQTKVHHDAILSKADIALVHCQGCHYVPVCKYSVSHCALTVNNSAPTVKFSTLIVNYCAPTDLAFSVNFSHQLLDTGEMHPDG